MNSLSIISSRVDKVIGSTPSTPTSEAFKELRHQQLTGPESLLRSEASTTPSSPLSVSTSINDLPCPELDGMATAGGDEIGKMTLKPEQPKRTNLYMQTVESSAKAYQWVISTIIICATWVVSCFYDEKGNFSAILPFYNMALALSRFIYERRHPAAVGRASQPQKTRRYSTTVKAGRFDDGDQVSSVASSTALSTHHGQHARTRQLSSEAGSDEIVPRRSIRIRLYNENSSKPTKAASVKSPTSPSTLRLTKYPRNTGPPRPLLAKNPSQKTLILDLDETLIHSLAKGGRLTSGHMVEVKLEGQHPILYYVHKRPYCEEFLRKVYKWYNLVVFTASVQEYADPVIDWLEQERKYFKGRYYRQHCTNRNGTYIKDISSIEPDLSKVIIIDNSPMSYMFHEDNAIPIEGWINDPTDIDLLNLIPLLHALHYVTDVRALLSLRMGEAFS
ncbi:NLI interacting factor-like phosphatase-domain-containing protein [Kalaharituber pfeilii]|nr:NLI interacting factor-like phosphatase-domain-containing protein [Kalaharituber pfeilii]